MNKSMYSLILADDVVKAIDRMAYSYGTSRSNYINRILAEHLSLLTPEKRIASIFSSVSHVAGGEGAMQVNSLPSGTMLEVKSILNYKYNPVIRYSVEITTGGQGYSGEFKVVSRTQSKSLLSRLNVFFEIWSQIEHFCVLNLTTGAAPRHEIGAGRYRRRMSLEQAGQIYDSKELGETIGRYIQLFDKALELYFGAEYGVDMETYETILTMYKEHLRCSDIIL